MISKQTGYKIAGIVLTGVAFLILAKNADLFKSYFSSSQTQPTVAIKHKTSNKTTNNTTNKTTNNTANKTQKNNSSFDFSKTIKKYKSLPASSVVNVKNFKSKHLKQLFFISNISDDIYSRIYGKSYKADCTVPLEELRYIRILYVGFDEKTHIGELIVNKSIADDVKSIFYKLYKHNYQLEKVVLVDEYDADDDRSMADNNTSSFNYRIVEGTTHLSKHSYGLAIDINPRYNPYIHTLNGKTVCSPSNGSDYADRNKDFPHKINTSDYAYQLFTEYGFTWGGAWNSSKDYQHFQKE